MRGWLIDGSRVARGKLTAKIRIQALHTCDWLISEVEA